MQKTLIPSASLKGWQNRDSDAQTSLTAIIKMNFTTCQLKKRLQKGGRESEQNENIGNGRRQKWPREFR